MKISNYDYYAKGNAILSKWISDVSKPKQLKNEFKTKKK